VGSLVSAESRSAVDQLDQLPADEERAAGRAGVAWATHPAAKGSRRWPGRGAPEPFASFFRERLFPFRAAHSAAHRAKPRPGCGTPRRGLASCAAPGREPERRRGARGGGFHAPFFVESLVDSRFARRKLLAAAVGRCHATSSPLCPLLRGISSARSASAQTAVIQEDKSRESVASVTSLTGWGAPDGAALQNERKLGTIRSPTSDDGSDRGRGLGGAL
jgi:hypothetical protein